MGASDPDTKHLSLYALERLLAGEGTGTESMQTHLDGCEECLARYAEMKTENEELVSHDIVAASLDRLLTDHRANNHPRPWLERWLERWQIWLPVTVAASVLVVLGVLEIRPGNHSNDSDAMRAPRLKDRPVIRVMVSEEGAPIRPMVKGERLRAGTRIGFGAACTRYCWVLLAGIDETDAAQIVEEKPGGAPWALKPDLDLAELPVGISLTGSVRIVGAFCEREESAERERLLQAVDHSYPTDQTGQRELDGVPDFELDDCVIRSEFINVQ